MSRLTYDWNRREPPPAPGDVLQCLRRRDGQPTGTSYLILAARRVRRREPALSTVRMRYDVMRVTAWESDVRVESLVWHRS